MKSQNAYIFNTLEGNDFITKITIFLIITVFVKPASEAGQAICQDCVHIPTGLGPALCQLLAMIYKGIHPLSSVDFDSNCIRPFHRHCRRLLQC